MGAQATCARWSPWLILAWVSQGSGVAAGGWLGGAMGSCQGSGMQGSIEPPEMQGSQPEHLSGTTSYWRPPCFEMNLNSERRLFMLHFLLGSPS